MATDLRANCDRCGPVDVALGRAQLELAFDDHGNTALFTCPSCGAPGRIGLTERGTRLLVRAGIDVVTPSVTDADSADRPAVSDITDAAADAPGTGNHDRPTSTR